MHTRVELKYLFSVCLFFESLIFSSAPATTPVGRALELANTIVNPSGAAVVSGYLPQNVKSVQFAVGPNNNQNTSQLWLSAEITVTQPSVQKVTYFVANAASSGKTVSTNNILPNLNKALTALTTTDWNNGVYLSVVHTNNQVFMIAQKYNPTSNQTEYLAADLIPNANNVGEIIWSGSYLYSTPQTSLSTTLGLTIGKLSNIFPQIKVPTSVATDSTITTSTATAAPSTATYDMKNQALTEFNFNVSNGQLTVGLPFITSPWSNIPVISDMSGLVGLLSQFTVKIYGVDASNNILQTLADLQQAIKGMTLAGFYAYIYGGDNQPIGTGITVPFILAYPLANILVSGTPTITLGVNRYPVYMAANAISYPIGITLQNIAAPNAKVSIPVTAQLGDPEMKF